MAWAVAQKLADHHPHQEHRVDDQHHRNSEGCSDDGNHGLDPQYRERAGDRNPPVDAGLLGPCELAERDELEQLGMPGVDLQRRQATLEVTREVPYAIEHVQLPTSFPSLGS